MSIEHVRSCPDIVWLLGIILSPALFLTSLTTLQDGTRETLWRQYERVKRETTTSHVMHYGDLVSVNLIYVALNSIAELHRYWDGTESHVLWAPHQFPLLWTVKRKANLVQMV